jgi:cytoskeleton protein RodZ
MGSFGQRLQREREMRGITLEEIATSTKIGTRSLRALEEEDFDQLPGGIFNKGFVRAYAKYLGIDEEQAVADYLTAAGEGEQPLPAPAEKTHEEFTTVREESGNGAWIAFALVALLAAGGFGGYRWYQETRKAMEEPPRAVLSAPAPAPVAPAPAAERTAETAATPGDEAPASATQPELKQAAAASGFLLEIHAKQEAWVQYSVDDKPAREFNMKASDTQSIHAQKTLKLVLGNAGGVELSHNGKTLPQLGPSNKSRTVVFTPEGLQR